MKQFFKFSLTSKSITIIMKKKTLLRERELEKPGFASVQWGPIGGKKARTGIELLSNRSLQCHKQFR